MSTKIAPPKAAEDPADREIIITRVVDAPRELVWEVWTDPRHVARWWGPNGFTTTIEKMIAPPEKRVVLLSVSDAHGGVTRHPLSAHWPLETRSTVTLAEHDGRTTLTLRWAPHAATAEERQAFDASHDGMRQAWTGTLDQLDAYLAEPRKEAIA